MKEATSRIKINKLLETAGWRFFPDGKITANIQLEPSVTIKTADLDTFGNPANPASAAGNPSPPQELRLVKPVHVAAYIEQLGA